MYFYHDLNYQEVNEPHPIETYDTSNKSSLGPEKKIKISNVFECALKKISFYCKKKYFCRNETQGGVQIQMFQKIFNQFQQTKSEMKA